MNTSYTRVINDTAYRFVFGQTPRPDAHHLRGYLESLQGDQEELNANDIDLEAVGMQGLNEEENAEDLYDSDQAMYHAAQRDTLFSDDEEGENDRLQDHEGGVSNDEMANGKSSGAANKQRLPNALTME